MKIAYLHGLESNANPKSEKISWLNTEFSKVYSPNINYKNAATYQEIYTVISELKPDLIVGSSMGGWFGYVIGNQLQIPTVLFNPALQGRSEEPFINTENQLGTSHYFWSGISDKVINFKKSEIWLLAHQVGEITHFKYNGGHRVPFEIFKLAISETVLSLKL